MTEHAYPYRSATLSVDGIYRYCLYREWDGDLPRMTWVMLNPSTADELTDDPTIRRCMGFARREGCGSIEVVNLYALRATKPVHLLDHPDPEGPSNWQWWRHALHYEEPDIVIAAWGGKLAELTARGLPESRAAMEVDAKSWWCLGRTADGSPRHPLYVRAGQPLEVWT